MRLLLDACMWPGAVRELRASGHDVDWVCDWPRDPGDEAILARARADGRVLVTLDKDFGDLVFLYQQPHGAIIRIIEESVWLHAPMVQRVIDEHGEALLASAIVVVEPERTRVHLPSV